MIELAGGFDPYEIPRRDWCDEIDLWSAITHVHACMYLILMPSPYIVDFSQTQKMLTPAGNVINDIIQVLT